jgi:hypothetical protein
LVNAWERDGKPKSMPLSSRRKAAEAERATNDTVVNCVWKALLPQYDAITKE